jgi:hypothetical protein
MRGLLTELFDVGRLAEGFQECVIDHRSQGRG